MQQVKTQVSFTGKAGDYFGIWIVNLLLSVVTLGIYSAWAKVRRMKYFYNNTLIDGVGFDYHAKPIAILKGRIIAFLVFLVYAVLSKFSPMLGAVLLIGLFLLSPWLIVRSMVFNARNTSHRGLRFDFSGKTMEAAKVFIGYPLLVVVTLGLTYPFVAQRTNKFLFENHAFGLSKFKFDALVKDFYKVYLKIFGVLIIVGVVFSVGSAKLLSSFTPLQSLSQVHQSHQLTQTSQVKLNVNTLDTSKNSSKFMNVASSTTNNAEADTDEDSDAQKESQEDKIKQMATATIAKYGILVLALFILIPFLIYFLALFAMTAYISSRIHNLVWNNTSIEHVGFFCNQRMRDLIWLYFSNMMALIFTFGLASPWVHIRMARYKAEHLALTGEKNWDNFVGERKESARALGGEMVDMFDMDISFG